jgi:hypothetical protein
MSPESPQYEKAGRPRAITNIPAGAFNFAMLQARNPHVKPLTDEREMFLEAFNKLHKQNRYLASFLLTKNPSSHCRRFTGLDADFANVMEPTDGSVNKMTWEQMKAEVPRFFLLCK